MNQILILCLSYFITTVRDPFETGIRLNFYFCSITRKIVQKLPILKNNVVAFYFITSPTNVYCILSANISNTIYSYIEYYQPRIKTALLIKNYFTDGRGRDLLLSRFLNQLLYIVVGLLCCVTSPQLTAPFIKY